MSRFGSFMRFSLIVAYSGALVLLGAHDVARRYSKTHGSGQGIDAFMQKLRGPDVRARMENEKGSRLELAEGELLKDKGKSTVSQGKEAALAAKRTPQATPPADALTHSDRKELDQLLEKVVP